MATAGTMAKLSAEWHRVVLVTATDGAEGEVPDGFLEPGATVAPDHLAPRAQFLQPLLQSFQLRVLLENDSFEIVNPCGRIPNSGHCPAPVSVVSFLIPAWAFS